ncbi:hypothetical protein [Ramlibacter sp.]|uniref:hypothetical protein n=1 Tax=Ramlibacter sp. TaxID=1917967 RepID=UPI002D4FFC9E|nr:hypothetical protein [Ramlibacter sp.]HYD76778.1 hypothetical protein [Ramlibacter sp.]
MHREQLFANTLMAPLPASGWVSWAPEVADAPSAHETEEPAESVFQLAGALSLLMWAAACLMAGWYL